MFPNVGFTETGILPEGISKEQKVVSDPLAKYYLSKDEKSTGANSLCIERLENPVGNSRICVANDLPVKPGKRYSFSCKIKSTEFGAYPSIIVWGTEKEAAQRGKIMDMEDAATKSTGARVQGATLILSRKTSEDPNGFNKVEMTFKVPTDCNFLRIFADLSYCANSKAWFADFELLPLD